MTKVLKRKKPYIILTQISRNNLGLPFSLSLKTGCPASWKFFKKYANCPGETNQKNQPVGPQGVGPGGGPWERGRLAPRLRGALTLLLAFAPQVCRHRSFIESRLALGMNCRFQVFIP